MPALTSLIGRSAEVEDLTDLVGEYRLVTVTGPGGVGKTRLVGEVARQVAARFADGVWLVELATVRDPELVTRAVAAALGVRQAPGMSVAESLLASLTRQQALLVLDNCEHVVVAVADLCGRLLPAADDVRVLATSREPIGVAGEARFRLPPLLVAGPGGQPEIGVPAVALFADRARRADPRFALDGDSVRLAGRLVTQLDGMPLAIELAAARVEALGLVPDARSARGPFPAADQQRPERSTAAPVSGGDGGVELPVAGPRAAADVPPGRGVPRAVHPGAAAAVAGPGTESAVLHLVDCSLLTPPRTGPDGRSRYLMLETLRAFGRDQLSAAGEVQGTRSALARMRWR